MNLEHAPTKSRMGSGTGSRGRKLRCVVIISGVSAVLIGLFYAEEDWRGKRVWQQCYRSLQTQGIALNWTNYVPTRISRDQNVFGVPEMVKWFSYQDGAGWVDLARNLPSATYAGLNIDSNTVRLVVAEIMIGLPGTSAGNNSTVLRWDDPTSRTEAAKLISNALGPIAKAPQSPIGIGLMLREPD